MILVVVSQLVVNMSGNGLVMYRFAPARPCLRQTISSQRIFSRAPACDQRRRLPQ